MQKTSAGGDLQHVRAECSLAQGRWAVTRLSMSAWHMPTQVVSAMGGDMSQEEVVRKVEELARLH
jgi:hypothetical protein